ncbi:MAG: ribosome recycling factor [Candidatus Glassbacteria bacterium]|nr:ribosome recycling factor [Candidatus Glassbacteria bacterium]
MNEKLLEEVEEKMKSALEGIRHEFAGIRTGKASPALIEHLQVDAYGSKMPLNQLGTVSAPEPRLLLVQPWDKTQVGPIMKAIQTSDIGLTPSNDGQVIRIPIPALNEERRKEMVKMAHKISEQGRVSVRHARKEANDSLKQAQKDSEVSEDQMHTDMDKVQELTDSYIRKLDKGLKHKEEEIMEV